MWEKWANQFFSELLVDKSKCGTTFEYNDMPKIEAVSQYV